MMRRQLAAVLANEPGTRIGDDTEDLHDTRVATRRLRAALSTFGDVLPVRFARFRDELAWVADALGAVRDLDVQLEQLDSWIGQSAPEDAVALAPLREVLEDQRADSRRRLLTVLDSDRYARLIAAFASALQHGPLRSSAASRQPVLAAAPDLSLQRYRAVRNAGRRVSEGSPPRDYHRLRIRCKRLRYALEFFSEVYPDEAPPLAKRLVAVQDVLGLHQDAVVAVGRLRSMVAEQGAALGPGTVFAMGMVARRYGERQEALRARFPKVYAGVAGKRWKTLRREMRRRRPPTPSSPVVHPVEPLAAVAQGPEVERPATPRSAG